MKDLIKKYDRRGPRYTSYPPVPFWNNRPQESDWISEINRTLADEPLLDIYLHVPFCEKLCYYCGCHRTITKDKSKSKTYTDALISEWELYRENIRAPFTINSLHFGGGTPTFLLPEDLDRILSTFSPLMGEGSFAGIEIDPRTVTKAHLETLSKHGVKRLSLGIQDFDERVQTLINRSQPVEMIEALVETIRTYPNTTLNFDLIYGLPGQTLETVKSTLEHVLELAPDTIAYYSYAHLPEQLANQRLIKSSDLPTPDQKLEIYLFLQDFLLKNGYKDIGMDHFARSTSPLASKELTRNFMGYTDKKSDLLIGLGVSAIGQGPRMFSQNSKDVDTYYNRLLKKELPLHHGHMLSSSEQEMSGYIQDLFCRGEIRFKESIDLDETTMERLQELEADGFLGWQSPLHLKVTHLGQKFLRNIAMAIDPLLKNQSENRFSRTI